MNFVAYFDEYVWLDDLPLAYISGFGGGTDFIHTDHLGAPQKMTDSAQNLAWDGGASDPFMLTQLPTNPMMNLRLPGQYFDTETGLHQNGARDYDPTLGRYIESDPIGLAGGINTFAYVDSNPLRWTDSSGLARKLTPSSRYCQELARKIQNIRNDIAKRYWEYETDPRKLPETLPPGAPLAASRAGHLTLMANDEANLKRLEQRYRDKCSCDPDDSSGSPVLVPAPSPAPVPTPNAELVPDYDFEFSPEFSLRFTLERFVFP